MKKIFAAVDWLSGESLLKNRPNGGAVIFVRALLVSIMIFIASIGLISLLDPGRTMEPSITEFFALVVDKFPWLGATFGAAYAAFYARYSSQWSYMANLYNQIMAVKSTLSHSQKESESFVNWQAGFIEDAMFLHLDRKPVFQVPIKFFLEDTNVMKAFISGSSSDLVDEALERHIPDKIKQVRQFQRDIENALPPTK